jgi:LPXTG-site transpeptidase (sortase) family protein
VRRRAAAACLLVLGILMVLCAAAALRSVAARPAVEAAHPDPHGGGRPDAGSSLARISGYAADHGVEKRPEQLRSGLWVELPSLQVALPIREGDGGDRFPQWVAMHYPGTARPGAPGNSYLYAHGLWGMFGGLLYARVGDQVIVRDYPAGSTMTLRVSRVVGRVRWNDTSWINRRAAEPTLTLQTCVDDSPTGDRFVVLAT